MKTSFIHKSVYFLCLSLLLNHTPLFAQTKKITGIVNDAFSKSGLQGVTIHGKKTNTGTSSDAGGSFTITVLQNESVIVFSYVGYETQEISIANTPDTRLEIALAPAA